MTLTKPPHIIQKYLIKCRATKMRILRVSSLRKLDFSFTKKVKVSSEFPYAEDHFEFFSSNVDKEIRRLKKLGFKVETEPTDFAWGRSAFLKDNEGRLIEITQKSF